MPKKIDFVNVKINHLLSDKLTKYFLKAAEQKLSLFQTEFFA